MAWFVVEESWILVYELSYQILFYSFIFTKCCTNRNSWCWFIHIRVVLRVSTLFCQHLSLTICKQLFCTTVDSGSYAAWRQRYFL